VVEVHSNAASVLRISLDNQFIGVATSDGSIKVIDELTGKILIDQKRHNLPITGVGFSSTEDSLPVVVTGSADYTYNLIKVKNEGGSVVYSLLRFIVYFFSCLVVGLIAMLYLSEYVSS